MYKGKEKKLVKKKREEREGQKRIGSVWKEEIRYRLFGSVQVILLFYFQEKDIFLFWGEERKKQQQVNNSFSILSFKQRKKESVN